VVAGLATLQLAPAMASGVGVGALVAVVAAVLCATYDRRQSAQYIARMIRFRGSPDAPPEL
ncbi:MAG TPA: hypothetical protein VF484_03295, partial [Candidatus Limnocylindrales bacterium]